MSSGQQQGQRESMSQDELKSQLKEGMRVEYTPVAASAGNVTTGTVKRILTESEVVGSSPHQVQADTENPRYLIENDNTKKETPYKLENIHRILEGQQ